MGIFRKENGVPVPKAGFTGAIDNILNKFSNNAVSNKAVTEEFDRINVDLTDKADKTDVILYPDVSENYTLIGENITLNYTAPANGFVSFVSDTTSIVPRIISINGKQVFMITSGIIPVKQGQVIKSNGSVRIAHFTYSA